MSISKNLNKIPKSSLNELVKKLPLPVRRHMTRCRKIAGYFLDLIKEEDWFLEMNINQENLKDAVYFHDIGKLEIKSDYYYLSQLVLIKEKEIYKQHIEKGINILKSLNINNLNDFDDFSTFLYDSILEHHESYSGNGFPNRLKGTEISFTGRFTCLCDYIDNGLFVGNKYSSDLFYDFLSELESKKADLIDPQLADLVLDNIERFKLFVDTIYQTEKNRKSLDKYGMHFLYSPMHKTYKTDIDEFEVKMKVNDPYYGYVDTQVLRALAQDSNVIIMLDKVMLEALMISIFRLKKNKVPFKTIYVLLSDSYILRKGFIEEFQKLLDLYRLDVSEVGLLIDEETIYSASPELIDCVKQLKGIGIPLILECSKTRLTSLEIIDNVEFDKVRFGGKFIKELNQSKRADAVVTGLVSIAKAINVEVYCDDITSKESEEKLRTLGVTSMQGSYFDGLLKEREVIKRFRGNE